MSFFLTLLMAAAGAPGQPLETVPRVDLARYAGKWYEIARYPNRFQRDCAADTTATYTLRPDGKITVVNECSTAAGKRKSARGTAKPASADAASAKLKVTFFWPFSGDYWVIGLDPDYRWAVVGEPGRKYLWILARDPKLDAATYDRIISLIRERGYEPGQLQTTKQKG